MGRTSSFEDLLEITSLKQLQEKTGNWFQSLTLLEAQKLQRHINGLGASTHNVRLGFIHTYTSDLLNPWLEFHASIHDIDLDIYHAPYGMNVFEAQAGSGLVQHNPDLTVFMLQREDLHPLIKQPVTGLSVEQQRSLKDDAVANVIKILKAFRHALHGRMVVTILPSRFSAETGMYDLQSEFSEVDWWSNVKKEISRQIDETLDSTAYMDLDSLLASVGRQQFFDLRYWYTTRYPFAAQAANLFARQLVSVVEVICKPKAKVIILDADNTMWGGVIGEDGINGIALGPDYPGNAFMDFQRRILDFKERGFILAICSKNNHQDVIEVLQNHPHQVLREDMFSALKINWEPKHINIQAIAKELNLGLDSFIFVDDSDYECGMVRKELPQVHVVQTPKKAVDIPYCLDNISRLEILSLTQEDKNKTQLYAQERQRKALQSKVSDGGGDIEEYLHSLQMEMSIELNAEHWVERLAQLTQKTNQFNLTTRRYSEQQVQEYISSNNWLVASFSLADAFGDSGVVGLLLIELQGPDAARIDTLLMSCRVIGRKAESAFLETVLTSLQQQGISLVRAEYIPTMKNKLVQDFYSNHQFSTSDNFAFERSLIEQKPLRADDFPMKISLAS